MPLTQLSPPVDELDGGAKQNWSDVASEMLDNGAQGHSQFFNPLKKDSDGAATKDMAWFGFPRKLSRRPAPERWELGEERDRQEEYCEWVGLRDAEGRLRRVMFTTEVPEYYEFLAARAPDVLLDVYRTHLSPNVQMADLMSGSQYNRRNGWNVAGAMHLMQQFNTLSAAVTLVSEATVQRTRGGIAVTNGEDLISCGINADSDRNSDPLIVTDVNSLARAKHFISMQDPLGLFIHRLRTFGWETPDGTDPAEFWKITRGADGFAVRGEFEVPASKGYTIDDLTINGVAVQSPSQLAEFIDVRVSGIAIGTSNAQPKPCGGRGAGGGFSLAGDVPTVTLADITNRNPARG